MNEAKKWPVPVRNMWVLSKTNDLEYIPVRSDPVRRVPVSDMSEEDAKEPKSIFATMDKLGSVLGLIACFGMYYLLIRMGYGVIW